VNTLIELLCLALTAAGVPRWLRVAQREHYLAGSVSWTDQLWLQRSKPSSLVWLGVVALFVLGLLVSPWYYVGAAAAAQATPIGLPYRGRTSKLAWTPRVRRLAVVLGVLVLLIAFWAPALAASTSLFLTVLVDVALLLVTPVERRLARKYVVQARETFSRVRPKVIAITGSYGKTTTKNYLAHLLSQSHTLMASPASFNNAMGLSRAVNDGLVPGTEVFIAEMGTYGEGEIRGLCEMFPPDIAVLTAIGEVHLQRMKTREGVLKAKAEITVKAGTVVLNADDDLLATLADSLVGEGKKVIRTSIRSADADVAIIGDKLMVAGLQIGTIVLPDSVHPSNAAVAVGAAMALGDDPAVFARRLVDLPTVAHRLEPVSLPNGSWILDDTYNSNPAGAAEAVRRALVLAERSGGRVHVVTPGMVELGSVQALRNRELAQAIAASGAATLVVVGKTNAAALRKGAAAGSMEVVEVSTRPEAVTLIETRSRAGDVVLFENDLPDHYP
jgi:UDP-N-acetylmuramoyl-tripeptide--D-alanyl-D-alanine ligase